MQANDGNTKLESWKEIAAYIERDERTARRWEELGLPVHRTPGASKGRVFAYSAEIDAWLASKPPGVLDYDPIPENPAAQRDSEFTSTESVGVASPIAQQVAERRLPFPAALERARPRRTLLLSLGAIGLLASAIWATAKWWPARPVAPVKIAFTGSAIAALGPAEQMLWTYVLPGPIIEPDLPRAILQDLDGDGSVEVLVLVEHMSPRSLESGWKALFLCFSARGELRWQQEFQETLVFGGKPFPPPWHITGAIVTGAGPQKNIWVTWRHTPWWPSVLLKLDSAGREMARFVNAGHILKIMELRTAEGDYILAGGVNNEYDAGMLAVLREDNPTGHSPQPAGSPYDCATCPAGSPVRYFIFPRTELNRLTGSSYNQIHRMDVGPAHFTVWTLETHGSYPKSATAVHQFSRNLEYDSSQMGDGYWDVHRQLFLQGRVPHSPERCPERRNPPTVREWKSGVWRELRASVAMVRR